MFKSIKTSFSLLRRPLSYPLDYRPCKQEEIKEKSVFISSEKLAEYLNVRKLEGITDIWVYQIKLKLDAYLRFCNNEVSKNKTISYLKLIQDRYSQATYRKNMLQIRRFLRYMKLDYMEDIKIAPEPSYQTRRLEEDFINTALEYFKDDLQFKAVIMLGASTGMRPSELYRLKIEDIDFEKRSIEIRKSKTGNSRTVYFNNACKKELLRYRKQFKKDGKTKHLFGEHKVNRAFRESPIRVKQLRKYFIQTWHRRRGSYPIGEILLGHSTRDNISLRHYLRFSEEELREEYDAIMN